MIRFLSLFALAVALCLTGLSAARDDDKPKPQYDPEKLFKLGDANKDGKLSKTEFAKLMNYSPKLKGKTQIISQIFTRLDTNKDGSLSLAEFKGITALGKGKQKPKETAKKEKTPAVEKPTTAEGIAFFEKKIRPVLVSHCYKCHSEAKGNKVKGKLILDTAEGLRKGGESGKAIVPGNPAKSLLIKALKHTEKDLAMPPSKKLDAAIVADFERWVRMGAPDPRTGGKIIARTEIDIAKGRKFWAFQTPKKPTIPTVKQKTWPVTDVDKFILSALEAKNLSPVGDADRRTLIRRVTFDLIGLPPLPADVEAFVNDRSSTAFEKVVDRLLKSKHFGERWGRHWLDVARYAESSGKQVNFTYPHAWRYRNWVIDAFNADKPYDQFIKEQIAGDLMPSQSKKEKAERQIATGLLAIGPKSHNERNRTQFEMDTVDEQIDTVFQAFQGLTVACARCHDHKFDPIPQKDYYALAGIFRNTQLHFGTARTIQNVHVTPLIKLPSDSGQSAGVASMTKAARTALTKQIDKLKKERAEMYKKGRDSLNIQQFVRNNILLAISEARLNNYDDDGTPKLLAMGVSEKSFPKDSPLYVRGEVEKPGDVVPRGFLQVMTTDPGKIRRGSGRKELAEWLASKDNPLTARVMVNRVWGHLFGRGLVASPDNFGTTGQKPSHPELLDHLATWFTDNGWSVKKLIRHLVLSRTYQQASTFNETNNEADPENALLWRMSKRRLEAEAIRDAMLSIAGVLELDRPQGSEVAKLGEGFAQGILRYGPIDERVKYRSVYLPAIRDQSLESQTLFDAADSSVVVGERATTTVPAQSLYLLNSGFVLKASDAAAQRLIKDAPTDRKRIDLAYQRFFSRPPTEKEVKTIESFLESFPRVLKKDGVGPLRIKGMTWSAVCQALFGNAEFLYRN